MPRGLAADADGWRLISADGDELPIQVRILDRWNDGSIRWALVDSVVDFPARTASHQLSLFVGRQQSARTPAAPLSITRADRLVIVETGVSTFEVSADAPALLTAARRRGAALLDPRRTELRVTGAQGRPFLVRWNTLIVEEQGPLRAVLRAEGEARSKSSVRLKLTARLHFHSVSPVVRLLLTVTNPSRAEHRGGFWELGGAASVLLEEVSIALGISGGGERLFLSTTAGSWLPACRDRIEIHQDSSGGENWASTNHVNRHGGLSVRFRGYRATADDAIFEGDRATPIALVEGAHGVVGAAVPHFWQNFPRALRVTPEALSVSFYSRAASDVQELQGGEQKTHECYLLLGSDPISDPPLEWCRSRLVACTSPEWCGQSMAVPYLTPGATDPHRGYVALTNAAIEGEDTFAAKRERVDEYGWRNFGDIYGDHEAVSHGRNSPLVSHFNNQYDGIAGFATQFLRTGGVRWWAHCQELAAHVIDIDIYHSDEDKSAYNHGLFWHTAHHVDAGKATHRTYPRAAGSTGGGPSAEHNYTTGLMLYHFMSGDPAARQAAIDLAQFVIDIDDGTKTVFRWLDRGYTGLATASGAPTYHGPGRGSGNSLNALVDAHRLTGERRFLDKAEQIIRRCTHPDQDLAALSLDDVERRWFYTIFLQALAKYLDHKIELEEPNGMYAYGRAVLLHYARWMLQHERPYLEKPEILEFPTETWAAQDLRKSEVFDHAARYADGAERERFLERAEFFFDYAVSTLGSMPTRTLARPLVLVLTNGFARAWIARHSGSPVPAPEQEWSSWPSPEIFVPQKVRAKRRALAIGGAATLAGMASLARVVVMLFR
jgi:hypothetical protein